MLSTMTDKNKEILYKYQFLCNNVTIIIRKTFLSTFCKLKKKFHFILLLPHRGSFVTVKKISEKKCSKRCMAIYVYII